MRGFSGTWLDARGIKDLGKELFLLVNEMFVGVTVTDNAAWAEVIQKILLYIHYANGVGESRSLSPSSDHHDGVAGLDESTGLAKVQSILNASVYVLDPISECWLCYNKRSQKYC